MTRPRVALVSLTPLATGGIETHLLQLVRGLKEEVEFILVGDILPEYRALVEAEDVPVVEVTAAGRFADPLVIRVLPPVSATDGSTSIEDMQPMVAYNR